MLDVDGYVSETNATNLFMVKNGTVYTPHADVCLPGITRRTVLEISQELGISTVEKRLSLVDFYTADEVFTSGTMGELTPVISIDGREIGSVPRTEIVDLKWPVLARIQKCFRAKTEKEGVHIPHN